MNILHYSLSTSIQLDVCTGRTVGVLRLTLLPVFALK